jgi:hypothetical protein
MRPLRAAVLVPAILVLALAALAGLFERAAPAAAADRGDRLDRFRELAASRLGLAQIVDTDEPAEAFREIYALLDDEIVENLASGGPFASVEFLQDRLDTFAEAWGGASLRLVRASGVLVGAFMLDERSPANSVRVYGTLRGEAALLSALYREGRPSVHGGGADGAPLVIAWEGTMSGWGTRPLRVEWLRREGDRLRAAWSTAEIFPEGLLARTWSVRGAEVRIRYEVRYPGWAPGCEGQTEQEDVYRISPAGVARVARRPIEPWHRELHAIVQRLTAALAARDESTVTALVPDRGLRGRLPAGLQYAPACDAREGAGDAVSVAAVADGRRPWALTFRRLGAGWRLTGASPVLQ